jgi:hypothetical protein
MNLLQTYYKGYVTALTNGGKPEQIPNLGATTICQILFIMFFDNGLVALLKILTFHQQRLVLVSIAKFAP